MKQKIIPKYIMVLVSVALVICPSLVLAGYATLSWQSNTEPDLAGYRVYFGSSSRSYGPYISVGNVTRYTVSNLDEGSTYYFCLTSVDTSGNESGYSAEVSKQISISQAAPPPLALAVKIGVFRAGKFYLDSNGNGVWDADDRTLTFGLPTDIVIYGDWNGDGTTDVGTFRRGTWFLDSNGNGAWDPDTDTTIPDGNFGLPSDIPITGDWNGDGTTDIGVFRNGAWYLDANGNRQWDAGTDVAIAPGAFGLSSDSPVIGDWNGDGIADIGVFRNGNFHLDYNGNRYWDGGDQTLVFGMTADIPVAGRW
jgi:hypothetical protein